MSPRHVLACFCRQAFVLLQGITAHVVLLPAAYMLEASTNVTLPLWLLVT